MPLSNFRLIFGECDCCGKPNRVLHRGESCGCEAYACADCHFGGSLADDADDLTDEIDRLIPDAETGEQWAHICALEAAYVEAVGRRFCVLGVHGPCA